MKEIKAIIRPFKLDEVVIELRKISGLPGITISEIKGFGKSRINAIDETNTNGLNEFVAMVKLELVIDNHLVDEVIEKIQRIAHTGNKGDGKIFIVDVDDTIKIRTAERGTKAI